MRTTSAFRIPRSLLATIWIPGMLMVLIPGAASAQNPALPLDSAGKSIQPLPDVKIRYVCLYVVTRDGGSYEEQWWDRKGYRRSVFSDMYVHGASVTLSADPERLRRYLERRYPHCTFQIDFSGEALPDEQRAWTIERDEAVVSDTSRVALRLTGQVVAGADRRRGGPTVRVRTRDQAQRWVGTAAPGGGGGGGLRTLRPGRTYAWVETGPGSLDGRFWPGSHIVFACLVPARATALR